MISVLPPLKGVNILNLKNNKITDKGATFLNEWLENNLDVKTLAITGNNILKAWRLILLPSAMTFTAKEQLELEKTILNHSTLITIEDKNGKSLLPAKSNAQKLLDQNALNRQIIFPSSLLGKLKSEAAFFVGVLSLCAGVTFMLTALA